MSNGVVPGSTGRECPPGQVGVLEQACSIEIQDRVAVPPNINGKLFFD
jgi:hypothetical protein